MNEELDNIIKETKELIEKYNNDLITYIKLVLNCRLFCIQDLIQEIEKLKV